MCCRYRARISSPMRANRDIVQIERFDFEAMATCHRELSRIGARSAMLQKHKLC